MSDIEIYSDNIENLGSQDYLEVGQWVWVHVDPDAYHYEEEPKWFGCINAIGTNYVEVTQPSSHNTSAHCTRVHIDQVSKEFTPEPNAKKVIADQIAFHANENQRLMGQVQEITARLGFEPENAVEHKGQALMVMSGSSNIEKYKGDLIRAKDEELPALFKEIEENSKELGRWMGAEMLPLKNQVTELKGQTDCIDDRIFNVSLYAGLCENIVQCKKGKPAPMHTKLSLMQRRLYMDEECLLNYQVGGMDNMDIKRFEKWLCHKDNLDRIMPFPRCMVAFKVRRHTKEREVEKSHDVFINFSHEVADKSTFLYIKNGGNVYRLESDIEFEEMMFPDQSMFDPDVPLMVDTSWGKPTNFMSVSEYEDRLAEKIKNKKLAKQWEIDNPLPKGKHRGIHNFQYANPHADRFQFDNSNWTRFDQTNVYYDECVQYQKEVIQKYNRIALIIQGLYDRSEVLHPHPPVQTWTPKGFMDAIDCVYDANMVLTHGDAPDFEVYRRRLNRKIKPNSVLVGQDDWWQFKEAERENNKRDRSYSSRISEHRYIRHSPYGNPGPGFLQKATKLMPQAKKATFKWFRESIMWRSTADPRGIPCSITVPFEELLNVSAYKPGDYKQFYRDPRTRQEYLKWAYFLLAAEEYHAGTMELGTEFK